MKIPVQILILLLAVPVLCLAQEDLGRLFYSPEQRQALDAGKRIVVKSTAKARAPQAKTKTEDVALRGVVTRSDGERTVWINNEAYHNNSPKGVSVKIHPANPASAEISLGTSKKTVPVKVGEQLDGETGMVRQYKAREVQENSQRSNSGKEQPRDPNPPSAGSESPAATPQ